MTDSHALTNDIEALTLALQLAVSAPNDEKFAKALKIVIQLSSRLTREQVETVKSKLEAKTRQ